MKKKLSKTSSSSFDEICGTATISPRGQIVIPKEARVKLKLKRGNQFFVIVNSEKLILIPEYLMRDMVKQVTKHLK